MANQEQLAILKQGNVIWNDWRRNNPSVPIDLTGADLVGANLNLANLSCANLRGANLTKAKLIGTNFIKAYLFQVDFTEADLTGAVFRNAFLYEIILNKALLFRTNLNESNPRRANFSEAWIDSTIFGSIDLSEAVGLDEANHYNASTLGTNTLMRSKGKIPEEFLRGCGLSDWEIESAKLYNPDLSNDEINKALYKMFELRAEQALQISRLFISYSHADSKFVDKLGIYLNNKGVRFWRDVYDATAGRLEKQIDRAIQQNPTVLLVLSKNSMKSDWVQHEVKKARELEKILGHDVLCPIALDKSWKDNTWPERIMEQVTEYNILDFSIWNDNDKFKNMFVKLIDGLNLYYKK